MSNPIAGVSPNSNGWLGGSYTTASPPTGVSGSIATPGAASFPGPRAPPISEARNDRGTNITIPYARVVPNQWEVEGPTESGLFSKSPSEGLVAGSIAFIWRGTKKEGRNASSGMPAQALMLNRGHDVNRQQLLCTIGFLNKSMAARPDDFTINPTFLAPGRPYDPFTRSAELHDLLVGMGVFDWVPDGVVLSKLHSPTGEPLASEELDMLQGALYNLAIAGPAICSEAAKGPDAANHSWLPLDIMYLALVAVKDNQLVRDSLPVSKKDDYVNKFVSKWKIIGSQNLHKKDETKEILLGAYQIGKILDSAASRQRVTSGIRRNTGGSAVNLNVAISWVSPAQLEKQYGTAGKMLGHAGPPPQTPPSLAPPQALPYEERRRAAEMLEVERIINMDREAQRREREAEQKERENVRMQQKKAAADMVADLEKRGLSMDASVAGI